MFGRTQRQAEEWESFLVKKRDNFRYARIGGYCHEEVGSGLSIAKQPKLLVKGAKLAYPGGS